MPDDVRGGSSRATSRETWTVKRALEWTRDYLERKGDGQPRLSAEWLLCAATGFSRVELYMNYDRPLDASELATLHDGVVRRGRGEPLQYVTGEMPFRHIVLRCAAGVLIPRPETEVLVDQVLSYLDSLPADALPGDGECPGGRGASDVGSSEDAEAAVADDGAGLQDDDQDAESHDSEAGARNATKSGPHILEVGTGTGCIALSIASERPGVWVTATDISPDAVALAERNRGALGLDERVDIVKCDLAAGVPEADCGVFDVLVSNPPYIPSAQMRLLPREVGGYEPALALDGGPDGLDVFRRLVELGRRALRPGGLLACELHEDCLMAARELVISAGGYEDVRIVRDLTGRNRIILAKTCAAV